MVFVFVRLSSPAALLDEAQIFKGVIYEKFV